MEFEPAFSKEVKVKLEIGTLLCLHDLCRTALKNRDKDCGIRAVIVSGTPDDNLVTDRLCDVSDEECPGLYLTEPAAVQALAQILAERAEHYT